MRRRWWGLVVFLFAAMPLSGCIFLDLGDDECEDEEMDKPTPPPEPAPPKPKRFGAMKKG